MKETTKQLNNLKKIFLLGGNFKKQPFCKGLKDCGFPYPQLVFTELLKLGVIKKVSKGLYFFRDDKPIYIGIVETAVKAAKAYHSRVQHRYYQKHKSSKIEETPSVKEEVYDIQKAITLLKENGYRVLEKITEWKEV